MDKFVLFVIFAIIAAFFGWLIFAHPSQIDHECKARYGNSYVGKTPSYSPEFCVNTDGSVKYLQ